MTDPALAIDFGTSRTKVAWRDPDGTVQLLHFDGLPYVPSLFYLPEDSTEILLGQEAYSAYEDEPLGVVADLKRLIKRGETLRTTEDRKDQPQALLEALLRDIKQRALHDIACFEGLSPEQISLTVPANAGESLEFKLKRAAKAVAWDMAQTVEEPVAAARYWLYGEGAEQGNDAVVVILDCGGGTTDWAFLQRTGNQLHRTEHFLPGAISVGGTDVDYALSQWVRSEQPALHGARPEPRLRQQLREWKEAVLNGDVPKPIRIKGKALELNLATVEKVYQAAWLHKVLPPFTAFLEPIIREHPEVTVLLVGGGATALLEKAIKEIHPHVSRCDDPFGAVIMGALATEGTARQRQAASPPPQPRPRRWS